MAEMVIRPLQRDHNARPLRNVAIGYEPRSTAGKLPARAVRGPCPSGHRHCGKSSKTSAKLSEMGMQKRQCLEILDLCDIKSC
jgi:hypothetical protein